MHFDDLTTWARGKGLEIVLLALGAVLLTRLIRWASARVTTHLQAQQTAAPTTGTAPAVLVTSERAKHIYALVQAGERAALGVVWFITAVLILIRCNVPLTTLVAPATVAGVAIGFGAQRIVADLLSGFFLVSERQYGVGDVIQVSPPGQTTGVSGTVEELSLRVTRLRTVTGDVVVIPNGEIRQVTNRSKDWSRVVIDLPMPLDQDIDRATEVLHDMGEVLLNDERWAPLLLEAPVVMGVESIDLERVLLRVTARTLPARQFEVGRELRRRALQALHQAGIRTASPTAQASSS
jgi:small-conductance mechanosensitive channel